MGLHIVDDCCRCKNEMVEIRRIKSLQDIRPNKRIKFVYQIDREFFHHKLSTKCSKLKWKVSIKHLFLSSLNESLSVTNKNSSYGGGKKIRYVQSINLIQKEIKKKRERKPKIE